MIPLKTFVFVLLSWTAVVCVADLSVKERGRRNGLREGEGSERERREEERGRKGEGRERERGRERLG